MAQKKSNSNILKNTLVLALVTVVCIFALALVNQVTRGPIEQAEINARAEIYKEVYEGANSFTEVENTDALLEKAPEVLASAGFDGCFINDVLAVTNAQGSVEGYVIASTSPNGYGGNLQIAVGIKDGVITGFEVVSNSETAGLGSKCTEPEFASQFKGKSAAKLEYTKTGASADNEIDAISGATITTNAVTEAVNSAIIFYQDSFAGGVQAEEEKDPMEKAFPEVTLDEQTPYDVELTSTDDYTIDAVSKAGDKGYVITVTAHNGYDGDLQVAVGIGNDGIIKGFATIVCNETKALGGQCTSDEYGEQFAGLKAEEVKYSKTGAVKENNEIDAIASATITTNATLTAVNGAVDFYNSNLKGE